MCPPPAPATQLWVVVAVVAVAVYVLSKMLLSHGKVLQVFVEDVCVAKLASALCVPEPPQSLASAFSALMTNPIWGLWQQSLRGCSFAFH